MSVRTLWTWEHAEARSPGRPRRAEAGRRATRVAVEALLAERGRMGARAAWWALEKAYPLRVVREVVKEWKEAKRLEERERREASRQHVEVQVQGAVWCWDGTQVGRDAEGGAVIEEVVRDEGTRGFAGVGRSLLETLEAAAAQHGWPLLGREDNGVENRAEEVVAKLKEKQVILLRSQPRVPQHNPRAARGMRELKEVTGLGKGCVVERAEAEARLAMACGVLNRKPRGCLGWKSAEQACAALPWWYSRVSREEFHSTACAAIERAVRNAKGKRARRAAEREAILAVLERFQLIKRWRGRAG